MSLPPLSQYADDTSVVVTSTAAITATFDVYGLYERGSGAKLNLSKYMGLWLGSCNGRTDAPLVIEWSSFKVKVLGVFLGPFALAPTFNCYPKCVVVVASAISVFSLEGPCDQCFGSLENLVCSVGGSHASLGFA